MNPPATPSSLLPNTLLFCRALRQRGLNVTPSEAIDAASTLNCIDLDDRREVFLSLRSVLVSRVEDYPIFEELFEDFWNRRESSGLSALGLGAGSSGAFFFTEKCRQGTNIFS